MFSQPIQFVTGSLYLVFLSALLAACVMTPEQQSQYEYRSVATESQPADIGESLAREIDALKTTRQVRDKIKRLHHQNPVERAWAAYQLAKLGRGAAPAVPYLIRMLNDTSPVLLSHYLGGGFHSSSDTTPAQEAARTLAKIGEPAIDALVKALDSQDENVRRLVVKSLGQIGNIHSVETLIGALSDKSRRVRAAAAIALGSYRHPIVSQKLTKAFIESDPGIRIDLVYALSQINDIIAVPFLMEQFDNQTPDVRAAIALALGKLRDARAMPTLFKAVQDDDEIVRANALYALSSFYTPKVIEVLIEGLDDPVERVREAAIEALTQVSGMKLGTDKQKWQNWWQVQKQAMGEIPKSE